MLRVQLGKMVFWRLPEGNIEGWKFCQRTVLDEPLDGQGRSYPALQGEGFKCMICAFFSGICTFF